MRDWRGYVEGRLGALRLERAEAYEVVRELADHLEECYQALRAQGVGEEEAFARTCGKAGNWTELRNGVVSAKEGRMNDRVKQIWIPSLVSLFAGWGMLTVVIWRGVKPMIWHPGNLPSWMYVVLYWPWLALLPLAGAAGAYLSRQARADGWRVYLAGLFPAVAIACVFLLLFPWSLIIDSHVSHDLGWFSGVALLTLNWVVLPGLALWLGVMAQRRIGSRTPASEGGRYKGVRAVGV